MKKYSRNQNTVAEKDGWQQLFDLAEEQIYQDLESANNSRAIDLALCETSGWQQRLPFADDAWEEIAPQCEEDIPFIPTHHLSLVTRLEEVEQLAA